MSNLLHPLIGTAAALACGVIFAASGARKTMDPEGFEAQVLAYELLPSRIAGAASRLLAWAQLLGGIALVVPQTRLVAAVVLAVLNSGFVAALTSSLLTGRVYIDCGCGLAGAIEKLGPWSLIRNAWIYLTLGAVFLSGASSSLDLPEALGGAFGALLLIGIYYLADLLLHNASLLAHDNKRIDRRFS